MFYLKYFLEFYTKNIVKKKYIFLSYILYYAKRPSSICIYCCSIFRHFLFDIIFFANLHFFHGFSKLHENQNILDMNFCNSEHPYLPWGHFRCHTKFGPDRFSCLNVYWIQRNRQTDKQSIYIYINFSLRRVISCIQTYNYFI